MGRAGREWSSRGQLSYLTLIEVVIDDWIHEQSLRLSHSPSLEVVIIITWRVEARPSFLCRDFAMMIVADHVVMCFHVRLVSHFRWMCLADVLVQDIVYLVQYLFFQHCSVRNAHRSDDVSLWLHLSVRYDVHFFFHQSDFSFGSSDEPAVASHLRPFLVSRIGQAFVPIAQLSSHRPVSVLPHLEECLLMLSGTTRNRWRSRVLVHEDPIFLCFFSADSRVQVLFLHCTTGFLHSDWLDFKTAPEKFFSQWASSMVS